MKGKVLMKRKKNQEDKNLCLNNLNAEYINSLQELNIHAETVFKESQKKKKITKTYGEFDKMNKF